MSRGQNLIERLKSEILVGDGANGSRLFELGCSPDKGAEIHNVKNPDLVLRVHEEYVEAGSDLIETNTFAANRTSLERYGLEDKLRDINLSGVRLALKAAGDNRYVSGSVGPAGTCEDAEIYREQMEILAEAGIHVFHLETFTDLYDLACAVKTAKAIGGDDIPVIAQMVFTDGALAVSGQNTAEVADVLKNAGADIIGINCGRGVGVTFTAAARLVPAADGIPVSAYPNAGYPESVDGRFVYMATPQYMADNAIRLAKVGVKLIGGCCGTNAETIRAIRDALSSVKSGKIVLHDTIATQDKDIKFKQGGMLKAMPDELPIIAEIDPPAHLEYEPVLKSMEQVCSAGADAISMADNPLARLKMCNLTLGAKLKERTGKQVVCHMTCRDRNILGLQSALMGAHVNGIESILAISGDPVQRHAQEGTGKSVYNLNSAGLIRLIAGMNRGLTSTGKNLKQETDFSIGCAYNSAAGNREGEINRLKLKLAEGAQFIMTQPVFDKESAERVISETETPGIRVFLGYFPLISARSALYLHNEVPGVTIPESVLDKLTALDSKDDQKKAGIDLSIKLLEETLGLLDGVYLISPHTDSLALIPLIQQVLSARREK